MSRTISRRGFLRTGLGATAGVLGTASAMGTGTAAKMLAPPLAALPDREVTFGMVGIGMQGSALFRRAVALPRVRCLGACDLYDARLVLAKEIAGPGIVVTRRYQELLERKDVDSLIVAVPDHWHKQIVVDALRAGKDVYVEKPMSHSIAEGVEMVEAARTSGRIVQVGSQVVSSALYRKAREMIAEGAIGEVTLVELSMGRNSPTGAWQYPAPEGIGEDNLDWKTWLGGRPQRPFDGLAFARWRCWREFGTGVAGDLMVHLISGVQFVLRLQSMPDRAVASGGIYRWKDGRDMPDLHVVVFEYGKLIVTVRLTLDTETPSMTRFLGPRGTIEISGTQVSYAPQRGIDMKPSYYDSGLPHAAREAYEKQWHARNDAQIAALPALVNTQTFGCVGCDETVLHLQNFFSAVANRTPVVEDAVFGHHAAAACHMANQAYFTGLPVTRDNAV